MKKRFVICIILMSLIGASFLPIASSLSELRESKISNDQNVLSYTFLFDKPTLTTSVIKERPFTKIDIKGAIEYGLEIGQPIQLGKSMKILLPAGKSIENIKVNGELKEIDLRSMGIDLTRQPIKPFQKTLKIGEKPTSELDFDREAYSNPNPVPSSNYENLGIQYCRGYSILSLNLNPTKYIPREGRLFYYPEMTVEIKLKETGEINKFLRDSISDEKWVESLVINPEATESYNTQYLGGSFYSGGICDPSDNNGNGYDYVIITRAALVDFSADYNWSDFILRKQNEGLDTTIVSVEDIISHPDYYNSTPIFNDTAAKIREFLRDAYQDWGIQYVLIAGDQDGSAAIERREMDSNGEYNVETDLYWSNLDNNFNSDQDYYWGEESDPGFDLYSELFIGSIPCDEGIDISNWMKKSFYYADSTDIDYLENVGFYGGNTGWSCQGDDFMDFTFYGTDNWLGPYPEYDGPWPSYLGFLYGFDTWNSEYPDMQFNTSVKWTAEPPNPGWQGGSEYAAIQGFKNAINNDDVTLICGIAHANPSMSLDVYDSDWESEYHNTKPFFIHDYGCHCGDMDGASDGVLHSMLFHSDTELAFAAVYNTGYGWGNLYCTNSSSALNQKLFWDYLLNLSKCGGFNNWQLGKAQAYSKDVMAPTINWDYYSGTWRAIIQCCLLFGDPAQKIKPPGQLTYDIKITNLEPNWNLISQPFTNPPLEPNINLEDISVKYNGQEYTWDQATTTNNPTGTKIIEGNIFGWNRNTQSYEFVDCIVPGFGYWLFSYDECELWVYDVKKIVTNYITSLGEGWGIFGLPDDQSTDLDNIIANYNGVDYTWDQATTTNNPTGSKIIEGNIFGWNRNTQSYEFTTTLEPGFSYWIYSYQSVDLKMS